MDGLELKSLNDARELLNSISQKLSSGPMYPWQVINHASAHIDKRISGIYDRYFAEKAAL